MIRDMKRIELTLETARTNLGLDRPTVARELGVTVQTIVNWEKGVSEPRFSEAKKLSEIYGIPTEPTTMEVQLIFTPRNQIKMESV